MGRIAWTRFGLVVLLGWWSTVRPPAWAQSVDLDSKAADRRARVLFENGAILYEEGRYEDAVIAWSEAYALSGRPLLLFNIANAEERLGRWRNALDTLNRYRVFAPADERDVLDRRIANIERRWQKEQEAAQRESQRLAAEREAAMFEATLNAPQPELLDDPPAPPPRRRSSAVPVTLFTVGGLSAVTATVFGIRAASARQQAEVLCTGGGGVFCPQEAATALSQDRISSLSADIGFGVAALATASGITYLVLRNPGTSTASVGIEVLPSGGTGAVLAGQF